MAAGLMTRGTTWLAGTIAADATAWKIGETVATLAGGAIYVSYLMAGETTSPATTGRIRAQIALSPNAKRENPDPTKWDDPAANAVDPTPKPILPSTSAYPSSSGTTPSSYLSVNSAMTAGSTKTYTNTNGTPQVYYKVSNTSTVGTQASYLNSAFTAIASGSFAPGQPVWIRGYTSSTSPYDHIYLLAIASTASTTRSLTNGDLSGCTTGYAYDNSSGACLLTDANAVMKPPAPCEIVEVNGVNTLDLKNPTCIGENAGSLTVTSEGARINSKDGTSTTVKRNGDGGVTITDANPTTGTTTVTTGPKNPAVNGYPVIGVTQTTPGSGTGTGGGGSCGGTGQVPCAIDDSGFNGKDAVVTAAYDRAVAAQDAAKASFDSLPSGPNNGNHGVDPAGIFGISMPAYSCAPLHFSFLNADVPVNICDDGPAGNLIVMWRWAESALLAWAGMWYLWRRFTSQYHTPS
jgi:hypothetical protein